MDDYLGFKAAKEQEDVRRFYGDAAYESIRANMNQCDGCQRGSPVREELVWPDLTAAQKEAEQWQERGITPVFDERAGPCSDFFGSAEEREKRLPNGCGVASAIIVFAGSAFIAFLIVAIVDLLRSGK